MKNKKELEKENADLRQTVFDLKKQLQEKPETVATGAKNFETFSYGIIYDEKIDEFKVVKVGFDVKTAKAEIVEYIKPQNTKSLTMATEKLKDEIATNIVLKLMRK